MTNSLKTVLASSLFAGAACFGAFAHASSAPAETRAMTEDQIEARYDQAKERCDQLKGNEEDVCEQRAKTERDKALADAKAEKEKMKAERKLAEEKCDAMSGNAKDACEADVKAKYDR